MTAHRSNLQVALLAAAMAFPSESNTEKVEKLAEQYVEWLDAMDQKRDAQLLARATEALRAARYGEAGEYREQNLSGYPQHGRDTT